MSVHLGDRREFMRQAYTALYDGTIFNFPIDAQEAIVREVSRDVHGLIECLTKRGLNTTGLREAVLSSTRPN